MSEVFKLGQIWRAKPEYLMTDAYKYRQVIVIIGLPIGTPPPGQEHPLACHNQEQKFVSIHPMVLTATYDLVSEPVTTQKLLVTYEAFGKTYVKIAANGYTKDRELKPYED